MCLATSQYSAHVGFPLSSNALFKRESGVSCGGMGVTALCSQRNREAKSNALCL